MYPLLPVPPSTLCCLCHPVPFVACATQYPVPPGTHPPTLEAPTTQGVADRRRDTLTLSTAPAPRASFHHLVSGLNSSCWTGTRGAIE